MRDQVVALATVVHNRKIDIDTVKTQLNEITKVKDELGEKLRNYHEEAIAD
tara:strand:- start:328 stop:480 length:153 start_codon:yes stop_codon:yes gene_type:complete